MRVQTIYKRMMKKEIRKIHGNWSSDLIPL